MNIIRGLVCMALLLCISSVQAKPRYTPYEAFREACWLSRYSCIGIKQPMVRESPYVNLEGAHGIYMGGRTIWMGNKLPTAKERYVVMVHEMVHYLQQYVDQQGIPFTSQFEKCVREHEAFEVSDIVAKRLKQAHLIRGGDFRSYGCGVVSASE